MSGLAARVSQQAARPCAPPPRASPSTSPRPMPRSAAAAATAPASTASAPPTARPDAEGRFGAYGGKYVPETLIAALTELEEEYKKAQADPAFQVRERASGNGGRGAWSRGGAGAGGGVTGRAGTRRPPAH